MGQDNNAAELSEKISDNPSLVSILLEKCDYAEKLKIEMKIILQNSLRNLHMDNVDVCRIVSGLLDSAIATAARCESKWVHFAIEPKVDKSVLIIVHHSENGSPEQEKEIAAVRKILEKYGNCALQSTHYNSERSVYLEIKPS